MEGGGWLLFFIVRGWWGVWACDQRAQGSLMQTGEGR